MASSRFKEEVQLFSKHKQKKQVQMQTAAREWQDKLKTVVRDKFEKKKYRIYQAQQHPRNWRARERAPVKVVENHRAMFEAPSNKLCNGFRHVRPTQWQKLHETMMDKHRGQVECFTSNSAALPHVEDSEALEFFGHSLQTSMTRATVEDSHRSGPNPAHESPLFGGCVRIPWHTGCQVEFKPGVCETPWPARPCGKQRRTRLEAHQESRKRIVAASGSFWRMSHKASTNCVGTMNSTPDTVGNGNCPARKRGRWHRKTEKMRRLREAEGLQNTTLVHASASLARTFTGVTSSTFYHIVQFLSVHIHALVSYLPRLHASCATCHDTQTSCCWAQT